MLGQFYLSKAHRFHAVAKHYIGDPEYADIVAFNLHMALEMILGYVVEGLLKTYRLPMYYAYRREYPATTTHNLANIAYTLDAYIRLPSYISFAVIQMPGWCVNARYSEEFPKTVTPKRLEYLESGVAKFLGTLDRLDAIKEIDDIFGTSYLKGKLGFAFGRWYLASNEEHKYQSFSDLVLRHMQQISQLTNKHQEDNAFINSFLDNMEFTEYGLIVAKLVSYNEHTPEQLEEIQRGFKHLKIKTYDDFLGELGNHGRRYRITPEKFEAVRKGLDDASCNTHDVR